MEAPPLPAAQTPLRSSGTDKICSILSHLSIFLGIGFLLVPLVVYLAMKNESEYVASNSREALNFHITWLIYYICCIPLCFIAIGFALIVILGIAMVVLSILAAVKASDGGCYRYPLTLRLVS